MHILFAALSYSHLLGDCGWMQELAGSYQYLQKAHIFPCFGFAGVIVPISCPPFLYRIIRHTVNAIIPIPRRTARTMPYFLKNSDMSKILFIL